MKTKFIVIAAVALATFFMGQTCLLSNELKATKQSLIKMEQECNERIRLIEEEYSQNPQNHVEIPDSLSEWDIFTLALMKVESEYNPTAVSSVGAKGYFQITPIYVEEVNRVHNTNYKYDEVVKSFDLSYEVFTLMQEAHNQEYDMDEALRLHNGDHLWYRRRVYKEMDAIVRYEEMRQMVKSVEMI
jgi:hypothetical protein